MFKTIYITNPNTAIRKIKKAQGEETTLSTKFAPSPFSLCLNPLKSFFENLILPVPHGGG